MAGHDWIEVKSYSFPGSVGGDANDSFIFIDTSDNGRVQLVVFGADTNVTAHTPEWSNLRGSDPMETAGPDDNLSALPAVQMDDSYAESHALYQDLFVPQ
jgi:hypothetical protein